MGASVSIALDPMCSAVATVCPPVGLAAGVFGAGMAVGATAAVCPPVVGIAAVFGAGVALGAALRVKATHPPVATDLDALDAIASAASEAAAGCLRAVKDAASAAFDGAKRFATSAACHSTKKEGGGGTERWRSYAKDDDEEEEAAAPATKREREMDHRRAAQARHAAAGPDFLTVLSEAASFHVAGGSDPVGGNASWDSSSAVFSSADAPGAPAALAVDPSAASQLLATRAAWRASEVMAVLETLKPLEEKLGANIPREAKSCICVIAAAAGVCLDVFKPPPSPSGPAWDSGLRTRGAVAEPRFRGHGTLDRRCSSRFIDFSSHM